jgi:hypothetical protein
MAQNRPGRPRKAETELRKKAAERRQRGRAARANQGIRQITIEVPDLVREKFREMAKQARDATREGRPIPAWRPAEITSENVPETGPEATASPTVSLVEMEVALATWQLIESIERHQIDDSLLTEAASELRQKIVPKETAKFYSERLKNIYRMIRSRDHSSQ